MRFSYVLVFLGVFILNKVFSAELKFMMSGKDEYPFFEQYEEKKMFMLYKNEAQFTTNLLFLVLIKQQQLLR